MHTRRERVERRTETVEREPADATVASFFPTNFTESFRCSQQKCVPSRNSFKLFICIYLFCSSLLHSFPLCFLRSSLLCLFASLSLFLSPFFSLSFFTTQYLLFVPPIAANLQVIRAAAFSKIKLSFCGWRFRDNSARGNIVVRCTPEIEPSLSNADSLNLLRI